jgi:hypothetical protein
VVLLWDAGGTDEEDHAGRRPGLRGHQLESAELTPSFCAGDTRVRVAEVLQSSARGGVIGFRLALAVFLLFALGARAVTARADETFVQCLIDGTITSATLVECTRLVQDWNQRHGRAGLDPPYPSVCSGPTTPHQWATVYTSSAECERFLADGVRHADVHAQSPTTTATLVRCGAALDAVVPASLCGRVADQEDYRVPRAVNAYLAIQTGMRPCGANADPAVCESNRYPTCVSRFNEGYFLAGVDRNQGVNATLALLPAAAQRSGMDYNDMDRLVAAIVHGDVDSRELAASCEAAFLRGSPKYAR